MARDTKNVSSAQAPAPGGVTLHGGSSARGPSNSGDNAGKSVKRKRSKPSAYTRSTSKADGGTPARSESSAADGPSVHAAAVAGPSSVPLSGNSSADQNPKTPKKPTATTTSAPTFTPASVVNSDPRYTLVDDKELTRKDAYEANRQRAEGQIIFGISPDDFLMNCMVGSSRDDHSPDALEDLSRELFAKENVPATHGETQFYQAIVKSGVLKKPIGRSLVPKDTHVIRGTDINNLKEKYSPDFSFLREDVPLEKACLKRARTLLKMSDGHGDQKAEDEDPLKDTDKGRWAFGQLITYTEAMTSNSNRTHLFSFVLLPDDARLIRFDHSGIIITERFPWRTSGHLLAFCSRMGLMTPAERGWDTSVTPIAPSDPRVAQAREWLSDPSPELGGALPSGMTPYDIFPSEDAGFGDLSMFHLYDERSHVMHRVLAQRPFDYDSPGYIGPATRWWIGVDLQEKRVVQFKEYWRDSRPNIPSESDIHRRFLDSDDTPFLIRSNSQALWNRYPGGKEIAPAVIERLEFQTTWTHSFCENNDYQRLYSERGGRPDSSVEIVPRVHHVAVFYTIVRPLRTFESTKQLVGVLHDAIEAIQRAYELNILHRNINASSVAIDNKGRGRVMNWDSTGEVLRDIDVARQKSRMVTLQTVSSDILRDPHKRDHLLRDDLESILYLTYIHALYYRPSGPEGVLSKGDLLLASRTVFENCFKNEDNEIRGGEQKALFLAGHSELNDDRLEGVVEPAALWTLMRGFRKFFEPLYATEPRVRSTASAKEKEKCAKRHTKWEKKRVEAETKLASAKSVLKLFNKALSTTGWPLSDGATTQFAPPTRPRINARAFTSNRASSHLRLGTSLKRSYGSGTGNLPAMPDAKRQKSSNTNKISRAYHSESDEGEPWDDDVAEDYLEERMFLGIGH
ncbi:hypothetical protein PENSPDRAFT_757239 [Peniophora sp. CONT]|nr:hypothetical protein PENSPDRAFT_757239 [Peniophora sp. CONT]